MQTVRDCIKETIKHTLKSVNETSLLEDKFYNEFIEKNNLTQTELNRIVRSQAPKAKRESKLLVNIPQPDNQELVVLIAVSENCGVHINDILGRSRRIDFVDARRMYIIILYVYFNYKLTQIALRVNRDHSTIIHSLTAHDDLMKTNIAYKEKFKKVLKDVHKAMPQVLVEDSNLFSFNFGKKLTKDKWKKLLEHEKTN
jgi:hypothetical protein